MSAPLLVAAVVPVFNPEPGLVSLCRNLSEAFALVLVVDDGSVERREDFDSLPASVMLLRHSVNLGKGRAIKTALAYLAANRPEIRGAVFADGDGQHAPSDVRAVAARMCETDCVTFGVRDFSGPGVPFRSWWGNRWTALEVRFLLGLRVSDTQTGLRAFPARLFAAFLDLSGERFEYEAGAFRLLRALRERIEEVPIRTIYIASNRASHFHPLKDTLKTQRALFCAR